MADKEDQDHEHKSDGETSQDNGGSSSAAKDGQGDKQHNQGQQDKRSQDDKGKQNDQGKEHRSYKFLWIFGAVALVAALGLTLYHFLVGRYYVSTKDAYVNGNLIRLQPQVSGTVTYIAVDQTQPVQLGQLLVQLDPHDADVQLAQSKANLAQTVRDVVQLFAQERQQQAVLASQQAQLALAQKELARDRGLIGSHGISQEELDRTEENARNALAGIRQAQAGLESVRAQIAGTQPQTHPRVLLAESNLRSAWLARNRTAVRSPIAGYMVRREVQLGQQVSPATEIVAVSPLDSVWVDANFKETQLEPLRIGQPVSVKADMYGSHFEYHGRILGLTPGTGGSLAVLPPENATGNWIKIVQRLPVRIGLDRRELGNHPLFLGLSTEVEVDVHDITGASLSKRPAWPAQMQTDVYAQQDAGVSTEIEKIVSENLQGSVSNPPPSAASSPSFPASPPPSTVRAPPSTASVSQ